MDVLVKGLKLIFSSCVLISTLLACRLASAKEKRGDFDYKPIPVVKCWLDEYDEAGNLTKPGGCEKVSAARTMRTGAKTQRAGTVVMACLRDGGIILPGSVNDDTLTCMKDTSRVASAQPLAFTEGQAVVAIRRCAGSRQGIVATPTGLVCSEIPRSRPIR